MATSKCRVIQGGLCLITQPYHSQGGGWTYAHWGIDLTDFSQGYSALNYILAHTEGTVVGVCTSYTGATGDGSYGNYVLLLHPNGFYTMYAHLAYNTIRVSYGQKVSRGQILAYMDNTGGSVGGHLHWEVRDKSGAKIDPTRYLNSDLPGMNSNTWVQKWHLYDKDWKMLKGWQKDREKWYYMDSNGIMQTGWLWDNGYKGWFLLASDGQMLTGWQKVNGKWYYLAPTTTGSDVKGKMVTGWLKNKNNWYYLDKNTGEMYTGTHVIDGKTYYFDASGALK